MDLASTTSVRHDLELLATEFDRCAKTYPPLFHERFSAWSHQGDELLTEEQWRTFTLLHPEPSPHLLHGWWGWNGPWAISEDEELMGRFTGSIDGLDEFLELSNTASTLISEIVPAEIQGAGGYDGWLHLLHRTALLYPSMLLGVETSLWDREPGEIRSWEAIVSDWQETGGVLLPKHPVVHRLKHPVFTSSTAFLRSILRPERTRTWQEGIEGFPANVVWDLDAEEQVEFSSTVSTTSDSTTPVLNLWRRRGDIYDVQFESVPGTGPVPVDARYLGCDHINRLIERAGKGVHVFQFLTSSKDRQSRPVASTILEDEMYESSDDEERSSHSSGGAHGDVTQNDEAVNRLKASIEDARQQLEAAKLAGNDALAGKAESTLRRLQRQFERDVNHKGRPRQFGTTEVEKARKAVCNALTEQYKRLRAKELGKLADHFRLSIRWIGKGFCYAYLPTTPTTWETATGLYLAKGHS